MREKFKLIMKVAIVFVLVMTTFAGAVSAKSIEKEQEKEVKELAKELEFIFEKAAIKDENGKLVSFDIEKIEKRYGVTPEVEQLNLLEQMKNNATVEEPKLSTMTAAVDRCLNKKIANEWGEFVSGQIVTTLYEYLRDGEYTKAAKQLIRIGAKGSIIGIAATMTLWMGQCTYQEEGWI